MGSQVTNMNSLFSYDGDEDIEKQFASFDQHLGRWNVARVTDMGSMFQRAASFNKDLDKWNVAKVTNMGGMFELAKSFNQDLNKWNVSSASSMYGIFYGATSFDQELCWDVSHVNNKHIMFEGTKCEKDGCKC